MIGLTESDGIKYFLMGDLFKPIRSMISLLYRENLRTCLTHNCCVYFKEATTWKYRLPSSANNRDRALYMQMLLFAGNKLRIRLISPATTYTRIQLFIWFSKYMETWWTKAWFHSLNLILKDTVRNKSFLPCSPSPRIQKSQNPLSVLQPSYS